MMNTIIATPIVTGPIVLGAAAANDGYLRAFNTSDGAQAFQFPAAIATALGAISQ